MVMRLQGGFDGIGGRRRDGQVALAQATEAIEVVGRGGPDHAGRPTDGDDVAGQRHPRRDEVPSPRNTRSPRRAPA